MSIHEPLLFSSRRGAWACCLCGWTSGGRWHSTFGAHLAFGQHLITPAQRTRPRVTDGAFPSAATSAPKEQTVSETTVDVDGTTEVAG